MPLRNGQTQARCVPSNLRSRHLDIATVVFSHVQCVKTRDNLARVSKLWRDASKPAAAYPRRFDFDAFPTKDSWKWCHLIKSMMDNDEALSLPYERVVGLLGEAAKNVCDDAASRGSVRLLKWARENNRLVWSTRTCTYAAGLMGTCPLSSTCTRTGALGTRTRARTQPEMGTCPFSSTCTRTGALGTTARAFAPPITIAGTACSTLVDNKCPEWKKHAKKYAKHLR